MPAVFWGEKTGTPYRWWRKQRFFPKGSSRDDGGSSYRRKVFFCRRRRVCVLQFVLLHFSCVLRLPHHDHSSKPIVLPDKKSGQCRLRLAICESLSIFHPPEGQEIKLLFIERPMTASGTYGENSEGHHFMPKLAGIPLPPSHQCNPRPTGLHFQMAPRERLLQR